MIVGSSSRSRTVLAARVVVLTAGAIVMVLPFVYMVSTSLKPDRLTLEIPPRFLPEHPTTVNYVGAWTSNDFSRYFLNSLMVAIATTVVTIVLSSMMAYAFARFSFPGRSILFGLLLLGLMVPTIMLLIPQFVLAKRLELLDSLWGLVVFYAGANLALSTFLLRSFFRDIPRELEEAMVVDGAGAWKRYTRLVLPLSRPALATVGIFTFLASWDEFTWALTSISDPDKRTLPLAIALFQGQHATSWGLVFAASVIAVLPVIVIYVAFQRQFVSGLTAGAVKG
jgi:multiple sugar transport system permease protein